MSCNCIQEVEQRITEVFRKDFPDAEEAELSNKALLTDGKVKVFLEFESARVINFKKGGSKRNKLTTKMLLSKCPFCGELYDEPQTPQ